MANEPTADPGGIDLSAALGATEPASTQVLTLYLPDRDKDERKVPKHERWVEEAGDLLVQIGRGVTVFPPTQGKWKRPDGKVLREKTLILYTYILPDAFGERLPALREFLHRFGRETNQGEVVVEFDGRFYRITKFDEAGRK